MRVRTRNFYLARRFKDWPQVVGWKIVIWDWTLERQESANKVPETGGILETIEHGLKVSAIATGTFVTTVVVIADVSKSISAYGRINFCLNTLLKEELFFCL